jgi:uncharacterized protein YcfJ
MTNKTGRKLLEAETTAGTAVGAVVGAAVGAGAGTAAGDGVCADDAPAEYEGSVGPGVLVGVDTAERWF